MGRAADCLFGWPEAPCEPTTNPAGIFRRTLGGRDVGRRNFRHREEHYTVGRAQRSTASRRALYALARRKDVNAHGDDGGSLEFAGAYGDQEDLAVGAGPAHYAV